jgi:hypothetical protein
MERIEYTEPDREKGIGGNCKAVYDFIGKDVYDCPECHGSGEYEGEYGPTGCGLCNSQLIAFNGIDGVQYADWGDSIERTEQGLKLVPGIERDKS